MSESIEAATKPKTCESCGKSFPCGAIDGACWCEDVELDVATLGVLRDRYKDCLCPQCLMAAAK